MSVVIKHLGCVGHLIVGDRCMWRRHTQVGNAFRVSTVGNLFYDRKGERQTVGADGYFETMVFPTSNQPEENNEGCGCHDVADWSGLEIRRYDTAGEAQAGHNAMVEKYASLVEGAS